MKLPLLGKGATVVDATNKNLVGITGTIVDETTHTLHIGKKTVQKNAVTLNVDGHIIEGKSVIGTYQRLR